MQTFQAIYTIYQGFNDIDAEHIARPVICRSLIKAKRVFEAYVKTAHIDEDVTLVEHSQAGFKIIDSASGTKEV